VLEKNLACLHRSPSGTRLLDPAFHSNALNPGWTTARPPCKIFPFISAFANPLCLHFRLRNGRSDEDA
jgi:hypothetical protein